MLSKQFPIILLLLLMLFIRSHHIERLEVFVDEGYHITRAAVVWDFAQHPARTANGKLLLYFWLGIFETDPMIALPISRLAIGLFSLVSGAAIYQVGKQLGGYMTGLLALALYAVLPLATFYERMTLADPFAAAFMGLVAWRSLVFVRRPTRQEGFLLGVLLALCLLAKLTMGLIPLLPVAVAWIFSEASSRGKLNRETIAQWMAIYFPPLMIAAAVVIAAWLPVLIPAALAINSDNPFTLINAYNLKYVNDTDPVGTLSEILPMMAAYVQWGFLLAIVLGLGYLLWHIDTRRKALFLLVWMLLVVILSLAAAAEIRVRYYMPLALPFVLIVAYAAVILWRTGLNVFRIGLVGAGFLWIGFYVLPFNITMMNDPADLSLSEGDWVRYLSGNFSGDALRQAADTISQTATPEDRVYSTWGTCQLLYLYTEHDIICLPPPDEKTNPREILLDAIAENPTMTTYIVLNGHEPSFEKVDSLGWEQVAVYSRPNINRPVTIWRIPLQ